MNFFLKRCHKPVFACSTVFSYNIRYKDWEKTCPKGVLLKKIFASFMTQKLWRFGGFAHIFKIKSHRLKFAIPPPLSHSLSCTRFLLERDTRSEINPLLDARREIRGSSANNRRRIGLTARPQLVKKPESSGKEREWDDGNIILRRGRVVAK